MNEQFGAGLATLEERMANHIARYERETEIAVADRAKIKADLGELKDLLHEVKGGQKLAKWVAGGVLVPLLTLFGFPKAAAVFAVIGK